jgi:hypothetical protein
MRSGATTSLKISSCTRAAEQRGAYRSSAHSNTPAFNRRRRRRRSGSADPVDNNAWWDPHILRRAVPLVGAQYTGPHALQHRLSGRAVSTTSSRAPRHSQIRAELRAQRLPRHRRSDAEGTWPPASRDESPSHRVGAYLNNRSIWWHNRILLRSSEAYGN